MSLEDLEKQLQHLLLTFANEHDCEIGHVRVDTRNFANYAVEVFVTTPVDKLAKVTPPGTGGEEQTPQAFIKAKQERDSGWP